MSNSQNVFIGLAILCLLVALTGMAFVTFSEATTEDFERADANTTDPWDTPEPPECHTEQATENVSFEVCDYTSPFPEISDE